MRKEYKIIRNYSQANTDTSYFGKYDKEGKTIINPAKLFYQTIAYSRRLFYSENYISHTAFINIKRTSGKLKFRFPIHNDYDGIGESYFEDCQIDIKNHFLKLRGFFSTPSGIIQLKETLEFVLENNKNLELKAEQEELEEFKIIVKTLEKELENFDKIEPEFYQGANQEQLEITKAKNKHIKRGTVYFKRKGLISYPNFKNLENLIDFIKLKENEVQKNIFYFNELDIEKKKERKARLKTLKKLKKLLKKFQN